MGFAVDVSRNSWRSANENPCACAIAVLILLSPFTRSHAQTKTIAERLGYPADSKLLIIHADDLAVAHSEDAASFDALDKAPPPPPASWFPAPGSPKLRTTRKLIPTPILACTSRSPANGSPTAGDRFSPRTRSPASSIPRDTSGPMPTPFLQSIKADDAEREIRAQVERAIAMGIHPTHLDSHMGECFSCVLTFRGVCQGRSRIQAAISGCHRSEDTARDEGSALSERCDPRFGRHCQSHPFNPANWKNFYFDTIKNLKPGLTELIIHLAHDDAEMQAVSVDHADYGAAWRQRDYDVITSPEFKKRPAG